MQPVWAQHSVRVRRSLNLWEQSPPTAHLICRESRVRPINAENWRQSHMGCVSCQGLPTKANSRVLFTCEKGYVATPDAWNQRRRRRGTSQHKTRETNAGGGGVRRNTRRVKPTPEEEEYVATKDAGGGGVCHNTTPTPEEEEYVATKDAGGGGVCRNTRRVTPTPEEEYVATTVN